MQEFCFPVEPARKASEFTVGSEDAVAGDEEGDGVGAAGLADGAAAVGVVDGAGDFAVGRGLVEGDKAKGVPDLLLEGGALGEIQGGELFNGSAGEDVENGAGGELVPWLGLPGLGLGGVWGWGREMELGESSA